MGGGRYRGFVGLALRGRRSGRLALWDVLRLVLRMSLLACLCVRNNYSACAVMSFCKLLVVMFL